MKNYLLTLMFLLSAAFLSAQVPPPPDYHGTGTPGAPSALPVDQYVLCLIAIALIMGIYLFSKKQNPVDNL